MDVDDRPVLDRDGKGDYENQGPRNIGLIIPSLDWAGLEQTWRVCGSGVGLALMEQETSLATVSLVWRMR